MFLVNIITGKSGEKKTIFDNAVSTLDRKTEWTKTVNTSLENLLKRLRKKLDLSYFIGRSHFEEYGTQNYLVFQPINRHLKLIGNTDYDSSWKSKGLSAESIKPPTTSDNSLTPRLNYYGNKVKNKFTESCLKQSAIPYNDRTTVNIYIVYDVGPSSSHRNDRTLKNYFFGVVTLTKNADIDKYGCSGYGIGFDRRSNFSFPRGGFCQNVLIFVADMSSSHYDNKKEDILVLRKGPTQELEHNLTAEQMYSINFIVTKKKFCLTLSYNGANSYLFVNGT